MAAPEFIDGFPQFGETTSDTAEVRGALDVDGNVFVMAVSAGETAPTSSQIRSGLRAVISADTDNIVDTLSIWGSDNWTSIVYDSNGYEHMMVDNGYTGIIYYAFNGSTYDKTVLSPSLPAGAPQAHLVIKSDDSLHFVYQYNNAIHYLTKPAAGSWSSDAVISSAGDLAAYNVNMVLDSNEYLNVVYTANSAAGDIRLRYLLNNGSWQSPVVQGALTTNRPSADGYVGLAIDSNDKLHVAFSGYISPNTTNIRYTTITNSVWENDCASSTQLDTESGNFWGVESPFIKIDSNDNIMIVWMATGSLNVTGPRYSYNLDTPFVQMDPIENTKQWNLDVTADNIFHFLQAWTDGIRYSKWDTSTLAFPTSPEIIVSATNVVGISIAPLLNSFTGMYMRNGSSPETYNLINRNIVGGDLLFPANADNITLLADEEGTMNLSSLSDWDAYDIYVVAETLEGVLQAEPTLLASSAASPEYTTPGLTVPQNSFFDKSKFWARDVSKDSINLGEVYNETAINVSLENILLTLRGERIFHPNFGTILPAVPFEILDYSSAEELLDILIRDIRRWEKRILIVTDQIELDIQLDENALILVIPYIIKRTGLTGTFSKKFRL